MATASSLHTYTQLYSKFEQLHHFLIDISLSVIIIIMPHSCCNCSKKASLGHIHTTSLSEQNGLASILIFTSSL